MKKLLIVLGKGGHTEQMVRLVNRLSNKYTYTYIIGTKDPLSEKKISRKGKVYYILNPRTMKDWNVVKIAFKYFVSSIQVIQILFKERPCAIISCGPAIAIHVSLIGKILFRTKIIFIESWSRVYSKSLSGKIIQNYADLFFVQWKQMLKLYPSAKYRGRFG